MEIVEAVKEHDVVDYDFMFTTGAKFTISIDTTAGDSAQATGDRYVFTIEPKKNPLDPEDVVEGEEIEVFKSGLAVKVVRARKQRMPTQQELLEQQQFIHKLAKNVQ